MLKLRTALVSTLLLIASVTAQGRHAAVSPRAPRQVTPDAAAAVSLCELARRPDLYDKKNVRTSGVYVVSDSGTYLYDPACKSADAAMSAEVSAAASRVTDAQVSDALKNILSETDEQGTARARVRLVGRFNDWNGVGYGHLRGSRFQLDVLRFLEAGGVEPGTPYNLADESPDSFMKTVEFLRDDLDSDVNTAFLQNDAAALERLLPEGFRLTDACGNTLTKAQVLRGARESGRVMTGGSVIEEQRVNLYGDRAVVTGVATSGSCQDVKKQYRFTNTYVKRSGKWQVAASGFFHIKPLRVPKNLPCNK